MLGNNNKQHPRVLRTGHRDSQFMGLDEHEERAALENMAASGLAGSQGCQLQYALLPNSDVELVRGSHTRWDTVSLLMNGH